MSSPRRSAVDQLLRLFSDVRPGESSTALLLGLNVFLLLTAYSVMKVVREPLILASGGAELGSYSAAGQALLLLVAVPLYGWLAARVPRRRLINVVTAFFVACIVGFYLLARLSVPVGVAFFIWLGVFNLMVIAQFWAFANDVYTTDEGKRLFPIVAFGASSGAVLGAWLPGRLIGPFGLYQMLLVAAVILVVATIITNAVDVRERKRTEAAVPDVKTSGVLPAATGQYRSETGEFRVPKGEYAKASGHFKALRPGQTEPEEEVGSTGGAFELVFRNRYLLLIALLMLFLNWVNTNGEFILRERVFAAAEEAVTRGEAGGLSAGEFVGTFYSDFQSVVNLVGVLVQLFLVSRIIRYAGVGPALLVLPMIAMAGYAILAFYPVLTVVRWAKTGENATDYSLQNTVRQTLFLPTTREEKYKAKQAVDSFFVRAGDVLSAGLVYVGTSVIALEIKQFAVVNIVLVAVWLGLAVLVGRRYRRLAAAVEPARAE